MNHTCQQPNKFIAMKKIIAMKIHRNEKEKFIAFSILAYFLFLILFITIFS